MSTIHHQESQHCIHAIGICHSRIIRIYHDARSSECKKKKWQIYLHLLLKQSVDWIFKHYYISNNIYF